MAMVRMLIFLGVVIWMFTEISAAPTKYDQRQEGDFNLHAKLENLLFIFVIPSNNELLSDMALQALDLKQQLESRSSLLPKEQEPIISGMKHFSDFSSELVVSTNEDHENSVRKVERENAENVPLSNEQSKKSESAERISKNMKSFEFPKSRQVPSILGHLMDIGNINRSKIENGGWSRNVLRNPELTTLRTLEISETLLKEQLLQKKKDDVALPSIDADKNDVALISEGKQQELWLVGDDLMKNCGPDGHRDASGKCHYDGSAGSPL